MPDDGSQVDDGLYGPAWSKHAPCYKPNKQRGGKQRRKRAESRNARLRNLRKR